MRKNIYLVIFMFVIQTNYSQTNGVKNSIFNYQIGLLGTWISNETKLTTNIALRSEIGLDMGLFGGEINSNSAFYFAPVLNIEPRYYYNIKKREIKNKNTQNNGANFFTTEISYHPDWFVISNNNNIDVFEQLSIIPKLGIRRNIGKSNFNFETGIGIGYRFYFLKEYGYTKNDGKTVLDLCLRIGYTFKN